MRTCGDCIVCCVYPSIESPELDKPAMHHCPHLRLPESTTNGLENGATSHNEVFYSCDGLENNCQIRNVGSVPECCLGYRCCWLDGFGAEYDRPDKSLLLFDRGKRIDNAIECKPLKDGQEDTLQGREQIARMSRSTQKTVIVLSFYERRIRRIAGKPV